MKAILMTAGLDSLASSHAPRPPILMPTQSAKRRPAGPAAQRGKACFIGQSKWIPPRQAARMC